MAAQSLTERQAIEAFTDTLDTVQSLQVVEALVTSPANRPAGRDAMLHLRAGLVQLRRGELTEGRSALDAAIRSFDETTIHASEWPWPWLGLARARVALSERRAVVKPSRHQPLGDLYEDAAARDIARALELDSAFTPAAHFLAELLAESPGDYPPALHRGIRAAASVPRHGASIQLLLGRLERHLHHDSLALEAFRRYRLAGGDAGVAALESARTRAQMGAPSAAVATYLEGARAAGAAGYAAYRADLAYVATAAELAAFDSLITSVPLQNRASDSGQASDSTAAGEWLATFWRRRDAASLRESGERLAEHLRRWVYAMREFRVMNRYWDTDGARTATRRADLGGGELMDIHSSLNELIVATTLTAPPVEGSVSLRHRTVDDLGFMYIRHGEPRARVHCPGGTLDEPPSVSWVYAMPEGTSIVHFSRGRFTPTPSLVPERIGETAHGKGGFPAETCLNRLAAADPRFGIVAMEREGAAAMRMLNVLMSALAGGPPIEVLDRSVNEIVRLAVRDRATAERALTTDTYPHQFKHDLAPVLQLHAVGTPASGSTGVLAVFSVRVDRLAEGERTADGRRTFPLRLRLAAIDDKGDVERVVDTLRTFVVRDPLPPEAWLSGLLELSLAPGTYDVRLLVTQPGTDRGAAGGRLGLQLPENATALTISDVVFGDEDQRLTWSTGGVTVPLNPLGGFSRASAANIYYELGGLLPGVSYRTRIEISKGESGRDRVALSFTETADAAVRRVNRTIGLGPLRPGRYVLRVSVEEEGTARAVMHERWLDVTSD